LSVSELAATTRRPSRFVGIHFVSPVPRTRVTEIVRGLATSDETMAAAKAFAIQIGKTPIEVFEYPGYVTTRLIVPLINEAIFVVMEGVASAEDVDTAMKLGYNFERGPLELADHFGLDVVMSWMEHLFHELGDLKYRPCPLLRKMVRAGRLGVKSGEGFFKYDGGAERRLGA
jgi:3-hydroxybutyryl-CoA dehydrogenase